MTFCSKLSSPRLNLVVRLCYRTTNEKFLGSASSYSNRCNEVSSPTSSGDELLQEFEWYPVSQTEDSRMVYPWNNLYFPSTTEWLLSNDFTVQNNNFLSVHCQLIIRWEVGRRNEEWWSSVIQLCKHNTLWIGSNTVGTSEFYSRLSIRHTLYQKSTLIETVFTLICMSHVIWHGSGSVSPISRKGSLESCRSVWIVQLVSGFWSPFFLLDVSKVYVDRPRSVGTPIDPPFPMDCRDLWR